MHKKTRPEDRPGLLEYTMNGVSSVQANHRAGAASKRSQNSASSENRIK
jgi:hypothetical protein